MRTQAPASPIPILTPTVSKRFGLNLASNVGKLGLTMLIGVWYVPFLVRHLGPAVYGLIPLASTITSYMALVTLGLNSAVGRYLTIALEQGDHRRANLVFNTSFWGSLILTAVLLVPATWGVLHVADIIRVPPGFEIQARWLFAATAAAFLLNEIKTPFDVSSFSRNRFDLRNVVGIAELTARWGSVLLFFYFIAPAASYVGFGIFFGTVISSLGALWLWRKLTPTLHLHPRLFDLGMLRELTGTGGWVVINQIGVFLYLGIDLLLANRLFGAEEGGKYAAVLQLPILTQTLGTTVAAVFAPTILYHYARQDLEGLMAYAVRAIKCLGLMLALPIALTCGFSAPLLRLWLGPNFAALHWLLLLMTAHLCINMPIVPLLGIQLAANRMKVPAVVTLILGLGNVGLALVLALPMHWDLYGIAAALALVMIAKNVFFTPLYVAHVLGKSSLRFFRGLMLIAGVTGMTILVCRMAVWLQPITGWGQLVMVSLGVSALYGAVAYRFILTREERVLLRQMVPIAKN